MFRTIALAAGFAAAAVATAAAADEPWRSQLEVGMFDPFHKADSAAFDLQLRPGWRLWHFGVFAGGMATTRGAYMGYGGITFDLRLDDHWLILPDAAVGTYTHGGDKDLGNHAEFRTGIALDYEFDNGWRVGAAIHHISNAGLAKKNPGVEVAALTLSLPLFGVQHEEAETSTAAAVPAPAPAPAVAPAQKNFLVFFDFGKSDLTPEGQKIVQSAADASRSGVTHISVTGHTDTVGSAAYNMRLSKRRALAVQTELVRDGVPAGEIAIYAKGKTDLLVPTADGVREPQNRRVQIVLE